MFWKSVKQIDNKDVINSNSSGHIQYKPSNQLKSVNFKCEKKFICRRTNNCLLCNGYDVIILQQLPN